LAVNDLPLVDCCTPLAGSSLSETEATELEQLLKALADRNRLRIINILVNAKETIERYIAESTDLLGDAHVSVFVPVLVHRFTRERLKALAQAEGKITKEMPEVLFVCVQNAGRSQMAAGLVRLRSGGRVHVRSAGSAPADTINPAVIAAMTELGVDMSEEFPKPLTDEVVRAADVVITMGCGDACPIYPGKKYEDWVLDDPAGQDVASVRVIRDEIDARVERLVRELLES
jgi:arsenate reductase